MTPAAGSPSLFRAEALQARRERLHGAPLHVGGPRSAVVAWTAACFAAALVAFGLWGRCTRQEHVRGVLVPGTAPLGARVAQADAALEARLWVPARLAGSLRRGQAVALRYAGAPSQRPAHAIGQVSDIDCSAPAAGTSGARETLAEPPCRVTARLPSQQGRVDGQWRALRSGTAFEADIVVDHPRILAALLDRLRARVDRP